MNRRNFIGTAAAAIAGAPYLGRAAGADSFEIGLVADAQYADIPPHRTRFYRESVARLGEAVEHFNGRGLAFCAHLGDLIDRTWESFDAIEQPLGRSRHVWHHLLGNHDFEVMDKMKPRVPGRLGLSRRYRLFKHGNFDFLALDTNDVSTYAHPGGTRRHAAAAARLAELQAAGIRQAKPWNGAIGAEQLDWLDRSCRNAQAAGRKVIILAHHPVQPDGAHNVWNAGEVLERIGRHRNIVAWLNGHNHAGAFAIHDGVPFVTMHGMVETPDTTAYATARILRDRMIISGQGREPSRELVFRS